MPAQYSTAEYWNRRYAKYVECYPRPQKRRSEGTYDWYNEWPALKTHLPFELGGDSRVLHVGCGTSSTFTPSTADYPLHSDLAQHLHEEGVRNVTNIDVSPVCIKTMTELFPHHDYETLDALNISTRFAAASFDCVIDKGCLDSMLSGAPRTGSCTLRWLRESAILTVLQPSELWNVSVVKVLKRNIEYLEEAEVSSGSSHLSGTLASLPFHSAAGGDSLTNNGPNENADTPTSSDEERRHHFIYICRKRV
ncbi:methylase, putative [Babesia caballi]|uniref:Methylase, putative n=1 Tax=Babesia caballi TaxID=5871 RepID=A0AAV4LXD5_BABCB|nr:methylase, putative [Babesia caballi]